jgi:hypothetical protein
MRTITRKTSYDSRGDEFLLYFVGDVHLGSKHCDERLLRRIAHEIADNPNAYFLGLGDYCEWINMRDPRFDPMELVGWLFGGEELRDIARAEAARFVDIMGPVAGRCLALCEGNHEETILRHSDTDAYSLIVEGLKADDAHRLDHRGFVNWVFNRPGGSAWTLRIFATHGSGGGRKGPAPAGPWRNWPPRWMGWTSLCGATHIMRHTCR